MRKLTFALAVLGASAAWGQATPTTPPPSPSDYLGPEVLSRGAGNIGQRAGRDVDLRFFGNVMGIYDTGLHPVSVDSTGALTEVDGLYGVEAGLGGYGQHNFRHGRLGLDYQGSYRHYQQNQAFNGANQQLVLGYTWLKSRRIIFSFQQSAGTSAYANSLTIGVPPADPEAVDSTALLFDNRTDYIGTTVYMTYVASPRTSYTIGGNFNRIFRQSDALVGLLGYGARGSIEHRLSSQTSVGVAYDHTHYEFPGSFGGSDMDNFTGSFNRRFGRSWNLALSAGIYHSQVAGLTQINLEPAIALILGVNHIAVPFYQTNLVPSGKAALQRFFRYATWGVSYERFVSPGNGVYLTSRRQRADMDFSYTGIRRWSFSAHAAYGSLSSLGQSLEPYSQYEAGAEASYSLTKAFHIAAGYAARHQEINLTGFNHNATRTTLSIVFSPGNIPISFR